MCIEPFDYSATQTLNGSCILGVVVGDSLIQGLGVHADKTLARTGGDGRTDGLPP